MGQDNAQVASGGRLSSPEQLNDYLRVTNPKIWVLLAAIALLLIGLVAWSVVTSIESYATGTAVVESGELSITFEDENSAKFVETGMTIEIGDVKTDVLAVGMDRDNNITATAQANVPDGTYQVRVAYKTTQVVKMLFN